MAIKTLWGLHLMASAYNYRSLIRDIKPSVVTMLHPKVEDIHLVREESPDTLIVGRLYLDDSVYAAGIRDRPEAFAEEMHMRVMATPWWNGVDVVQTNNEVSQSWQWVDGHAPSGLERLAVYSSKWMTLAQSLYRCGIGAFSEGNPDIEKGWPLLHHMLRQGIEGGHVLLVHEYGWPDFWSPPGKWNLGRFAERVHHTLPEDVQGIGVIISEIGQDRLIVGHKGGWRSSGKSASDTARALHDFHNDLNAWRHRGVNLLGTSLFCAGEVGWGDYDYTHGGDASPLGIYRNMLPDHIEPLHPHLSHPHDPPPSVPVDPEISDYMLDKMKETANAKQCIELNAEAALQKAIFEDGYVPVGNEDGATFGKRTFVVQKGEHLGTGKAILYVVNIDDYSQVHRFDY